MIVQDSSVVFLVYQNNKEFLVSSVQFIVGCDLVCFFVFIVCENVNPKVVHMQGRIQMFGQHLL